MRNISCFGLILFYLLISLALMAQTKSSIIKETNKDKKISLSDIIGNWYSVDSFRHRIRFVNLNDNMVEIKGLKHGVGNYLFMVYGDSISVHGTAANWPPYDCTLRLVSSKENLEIVFYHFSDQETTRVIYKR